MTRDTALIQVPAHLDRPQEDRVGAWGALAVVADGVTRTPPPHVPYPDPSPAAGAAEAVVSTVLAARPASRCGLAHAMVAANARIERLNRAIGLHRSYRERRDDLAGAVGAAAVLDADSVHWSYIGDAGIGLVDGEGRVVSVTPDDIAPLRPAFPASSLPGHVRMRIIRERFRNVAGRSGYGVLTGEPGASDYVRDGTWALSGAERAVIVFSDGFRPLLDDGGVLDALASPADGDAAAHIVARARARGLTDEISLAIINLDTT